jgi:hypothetical protein
VVASDKLFFWLFQNQPDRILQLQSDLPADAGGYRFSAPVLKEREYWLDGLFLPPPERPDLPALILEAQVAPLPRKLTPVSCGASMPRPPGCCNSSRASAHGGKPIPRLHHC